MNEQSKEVGGTKEYVGGVFVLDTTGMPLLPSQDEMIEIDELITKIMRKHFVCADKPIIVGN